MHRSFAALAGVTLAAGLMLGAGTATAAESPEPGTPECDMLVAADVTVLEALAERDEAAGVLNLLGADDEGFGDAQALVASLGVQLDEARTAATAALCLGSTEEPVTEEPVTEEPAEEQPDAVAAVRAEIEALDCDGFGAQLGAIQDAILDLPEGTSLETIGGLSDALNEKLADLGYCVESPTVTAPAPTTIVEAPPVIDRDVIVRPLDDDDSVARATQVREVPEGSVATGSA